MRKILFIVTIVAMCWFAADAARAAELQAPQNAVAGIPASIVAGGSGDATLYLVGPGSVVKREVRLGQPIELRGEELRDAGRYVAIVKGGGATQSAAFFVSAGAPAQIAFLARPSRVPVAKPGVITGAAFVFDDYRNLALGLAEVKFELTVQGTTAAKNAPARYGIAWTRMDSAPKEGAAQFVASAGGASVRRVVQQVASEPCNLRMRAQRTAKAILVETDPIRDCSGNAVPDGTIVTFTAVDAKGRSTVDARIKRGVAKAELPLSENTLISVAAGVVSGNEVRVGGRP